MALDAGRAADGPAIDASFDSAINGLVNREVGLREISTGIHKFCGGLGSVGARRPFQFQLAQNEIAVPSPAGAKVRQFFVRQRFEHNPGDSGERRMGNDAEVGRAFPIGGGDGAIAVFG